MPACEIHSPALVIDAAIVRRNLQRMADYVAQHDLKLRPHTKTHKSLRVAQMQLDAGAAGVTVAKPGEALIMAAVADDILMAYPAVQPQRAAELAHLAREKTIRVAIDSTHAANVLAEAASQAGSTIGILVDMDVGFHRTGVQSVSDAVALAQHVQSCDGLRLDGIMYYPGHVRRRSENTDRQVAEVGAKLADALAAFRRIGLCTDIVSGGSTPAALLSHRIAGTTEIRPGTYVYNDMTCVRGGYATLDDCAARVHCTVVSDAVPGQIVIDAGSKTLTSDRCGPDPDSGYGYVVELPNAILKLLTEEHGQIDITTCDSKPQVGDRLTVIPNHVCPCVNLHDHVWWQEADTPPVPIVVDARGKVY